MAKLLLLVIFAFICASMFVAFRRSRDPLHPMMFLGPMLIYVYVLRPWVLLANGDLQAFVDDGQIVFAQVLFTLGIILFCGGMLHASRNVYGRIRLQVPQHMQGRLFTLGCFLGTFSVVAYWFAIFRSGGFFAVYGQAKGYSSAGSGWINELVNLSIPSAALLVLAWQGQRSNRHYLLLAVFFASPLLIHGFLGARRGPAFIILATLLVAWYIGSGKRISLWKVTTRFGLIGLLTLFLVAQRQQIYIGSNFDFSFQEFWTRVVPSDVNESDDTVFMYGFVSGIHETRTHYWGMRYAATYLVRPIPRQLWPTKYEDLGLGWMVDQSDFAGITDAQWHEVLGWVPTRGSAVGFAADLFLEFAWAGLIGCFGFGWLWSRANRGGGLWTLLYIQAAALSAYVPTQSVSAILHRFLFMTLATVLVWKYYIGRTNLPIAEAYVTNLVGETVPLGSGRPQTVESAIGA